jgi:two-component system, LuxR family, response regulator FixJ
MASMVYLIDDDAAVRKAITLLLGSVQLNVETFSSAEDFLAAYRPDTNGGRAIVVTDVRMPGMSGLELQDELNRRNLQIPVILISAHADLPQAVRAMKAGAVTVLEKPVNEQDLIDTIHQAAKQPLPTVALDQAKVLDGYRKLLTKRQCDVFDQVLKGLQTKEVAINLGLSHRTVEIHRANILRRLEMGSFSQIVRQMLNEQELH